jgi:hypothetical protein
MIDMPVVHATVLPYVTDESASALLMVTKDLKVIDGVERSISSLLRHKSILPTSNCTLRLRRHKAFMSCCQTWCRARRRSRDMKRTLAGVNDCLLATFIRNCRCRETRDGETMNVVTLRQTWRTALGFPSTARVTVVPKRPEGAYWSVFW